MITIQDLVLKLPIVNFATLRFICLHLWKVSEYSDVNRMTARNLSIVFGPTLLRPPKHLDTLQQNMTDMPFLCSVVEILISHAGWVFSPVEYEEIGNTSDINNDVYKPNGEGSIDANYGLLDDEIDSDNSSLKSDDDKNDESEKELRLSNILRAFAKDQLGLGLLNVSDSDDQKYSDLWDGDDDAVITYSSHSSELVGDQSKVPEIVLGTSPPAPKQRYHPHKDSQRELNQTSSVESSVSPANISPPQSSIIPSLTVINERKESIQHVKDDRRKGHLILSASDLDDVMKVIESSRNKINNTDPKRLSYPKTSSHTISASSALLLHSFIPNISTRSHSTSSAYTTTSSTTVPVMNALSPLPSIMPVTNSLSVICIDPPPPPPKELKRISTLSSISSLSAKSKRLSDLGHASCVAASGRVIAFEHSVDNQASLEVAGSERSLSAADAPRLSLHVDWSLGLSFLES